jgi:hypothetical protein
MQLATITNAYIKLGHVEAVIETGKLRQAFIRLRYVAIRLAADASPSGAVSNLLEMLRLDIRRATKVDMPRNVTIETLQTELASLKERAESLGNYINARMDDNEYYLSYFVAFLHGLDVITVPMLDFCMLTPSLPGLECRYSTRFEEQRNQRFSATTPRTHGFSSQ